MSGAAAWLSLPNGIQPRARINTVKQCHLAPVKDLWSEQEISCQIIVLLIDGTKFYGDN